MRTDFVQKVRRGLLIVVLLTLVVTVVSVYMLLQSNSGRPALQQLLDAMQGASRPRVGIVAGHSDYDPGAVCPDGLTEVEVNLRVANVVATLLREDKIEVDILTEFDDRLRGYRADAFVSIHADSCEFDLSGFKVASLEGGSAESAQLAGCFWTHYGADTGLAPHPDTITYDMRDYHAFREISPTTPAAIIEIGFLSGDRQLLTQAPDRVAAGIVASLQCFLAPVEEP